MFRNGMGYEIESTPEQRLTTRRRVLRDGGALLLSTVLQLRAAHAEKVLPIPNTEAPAPFDRSIVTELARKLAASKFVPSPTDDLPSQLVELTYEQYRDISFARDAAIWAGTELPFRLHLFHRGFYFVDRVDVAIVDDGKAQQIPYSPDMFIFGDRVREPSPATDIGFSGIRLLSPINRPDKLDEVAVFQGASYFRSLGRNQAYGLSARGLALKTAAQDGEEFPRFRRFWIERPDEVNGPIVIHALLDSESIAGAYRFSILPGSSTVMDVEVKLFPRVELAKVGLAPATSMFFFGPSDRQDIDDYRPEVHDSDGLLIANGRGEILWRPLANPATLQISAFIDSAPRGFGLIQRNRDFESYQDVEAAYERRTSLWVEPIGDWRDGSVTLIEIPTDSEIHDNIVAYWAPAEPLAAGGEYSLAYRLFWGGEPQLSGRTVRVTSTRSGRATLSGPSPLRRFVVDYEPTDTEIPDGMIAPTATVSASAGKVDEVVVLPNPETGGWRLTFRLDPQDAQLIELRASLDLAGSRQFETWVYRWTA